VYAFRGSIIYWALCVGSSFVRSSTFSRCSSDAVPLNQICSLLSDSRYPRSIRVGYSHSRVRSEVLSCPAICRKRYEREPMGEREAARLYRAVREGWRVGNFVARGATNTRPRAVRARSFLQVVRSSIQNKVFSSKAKPASASTQGIRSRSQRFRYGAPSVDKVLVNHPSLASDCTPVWRTIAFQTPG